MLGRYLKKYRLGNNLTQEEMAQRIGTSQSYYSLLENSVKKPGIDLVRRIAKATDTDPTVIRSLL